MAPLPHIDDEMLDRYSLRNISEEECGRVEEHLLVCEDCRERLTGTDAYVKAMRAAGAKLRDESQRRGRMPELFHGRRWIWAAGFAMGAALFLAGLQRHAWRVKDARPVEIVLAAMRGQGTSEPVAPQGRPLRLMLDLTGVPAFGSYRTEVVNARGEDVFERVVVRDGDKATADVPSQASGVHFVRVYSPAGDLLREYSLDVGR